LRVLQPVGILPERSVHSMRVEASISATKTATMKTSTAKGGTTR